MLKVHTFMTGTMTYDSAFRAWDVAGTDFGKMITVPIWQALITGGPETILFDTGFGDPDLPLNKHWGAKRTPDQEITTQLKKIGYKPEDIDTVVNSHLHVDHAGNNKLFKNAKFYVQRVELGYAYLPASFQTRLYDRIDFDHPLDYITIKGDYELFDGVEILSTPGHTPGHQSLTVDIGDGKLILCGDAAMCRRNWDELVISGTSYALFDSLDSLRRKLKRIRNGIPLFSHDMDFFEKEMKRVYE